MDSIAYIHLTKGQRAIVDAEDLPRIVAASKSWQASVVGRLSKRYVPQTKIRVNGVQVAVFLSRLIMNAPNGVLVDHINHDTLDNRKSNLRLATPSQNGCNQKKQNRETSSRFKGVCLFRLLNLWLAYIKFEGKRTYLGYFKDEEAAARAYDRAALNLHGEFACLNFRGTN